ncbi:hypothetical protein [Nonomuraea maheshkhaliensis]|uniref:hypothetical protein n=1 Tax=Nonomuraea maheshkhaliensis TaxID=419590 RepID=UPI0031F8CA85
MTADDISTTRRQPQRLRSALVDQLSAQGIIRTPSVENALRAVPRHILVPGVSLEEAYARHWPGEDGVLMPTEPAIAAVLLELTQTLPGMRVLKIGSTTAYPSALLAHLAGEHGQVTSINTEGDLGQAVINQLSLTGYDSIRVLNGNAPDGCADGAPYDRLISFNGMWDVPPAWLRQIAPDGRLVVPLRMRGSVYRVLAFTRTNDHWEEVASEECAFARRLGGIADDPLTMVSLTTAGTVTLHLHQDQHVIPEKLLGVIDRTRSEFWTKVPITFGNRSGDYSMLELFLSVSMRDGLSRMDASMSAIDTGLVAPMFPWGSMAVPGRDGDLAYLTLRPTGETVFGDPVFEISVIGHGLGGDALAGHLADQICLWDRDYRHAPLRVALQRADSPQRITGTYELDRPNALLAVSWG